MQCAEFIARLDSLIQSRSILNHPFYQAWAAGELTTEQLATYAEIYYPHVKAFPEHLKSAAESACDPEVKKELESNLADELSNPSAHPELWLDFAEGMGAERGEVEAAQPRPAAANIVETFSQFARGETAQALAAFYAYESQQPGVSCSKMDGLRNRYGIHDRKTLAYFEVHAEADVRHSKGERDALVRCIEAGQSQELAYEAAEKLLDAYWGLLDGVCEETGIALAC